MKNYIILFIVALTVSCNNSKNQSEKDLVMVEERQTIPTHNFYDLKAEDIDGNDFSFSQLKGKKVMIVNTASECVFTPQYEDLQKLYDTYKDNNFTIIGFPANNFGGQEPGTNIEIKQFCTQNFNVSFPMMSKISVKGDDQHPVYQFLTQKDKNGKFNSEVKWNFQKYLINPDGSLEEVYYSKTNPMDDKIQEWIKK